MQVIEGDGDVSLSRALQTPLKLFELTLIDSMSTAI